MASKKKKTSSKAAPAKKSAGLSAGAQWALLIGVVVLGVGFLIFNAARDAVDDGGAGVVASEAFDLPNLQAEDDPTQRIRLADFAGTPTVVNFFASWCDACDEELPAFRDTALDLEGEVDFIFVNSNETGNWRPMAERNDILQFPIAQDIQGLSRNGLYRDLGVAQGMPITAFYDEQGNLLQVARSAFNESQLRGTLSQLNLTN